MNRKLPIIFIIAIPKTKNTIIELILYFSISVYNTFDNPNPPINASIVNNNISAKVSYPLMKTLIIKVKAIHK